MHKILYYNVALKVHGPISKDGIFSSNDASSLKKSLFQISVKSVKPFGCMKRLRMNCNCLYLTV